MKKYFLSLILSSFITTFTTTQLKAQRVKTLIAKGDTAYAKNDYLEAAFYYNQAVLKDSSQINLQYKYAQARRLNFDYDIAYHWYSKVNKQDSLGKLFPECIFWLATIKKGNGNYKEAKGLFANYVQKNKDAGNSYLLVKAKQEMESCDVAQGLISDPDNEIKIIHLDTTVNSKLSEYAPYKVDSILYFSSIRNSGNRDVKNNINYNKLYASIQADSNQWKKVKELDTLFNARDIHTANASFNTDKTKMFLTRCHQKNEQYFICDIYVSELKNNVWSSLKKLPPEINAPGFTNSQPSVGIVDDKEVLFFSSDRSGGEGKIDIWYSKMNSDGTYEKPVNAGKQVNSAEDDITPFYCNRCKELFFSSTWYKGLGGFDVFKSAYKDGSFQEPENAGVPINSNYNDIYFSMNAANTEAFLSSNRAGSFYEGKKNCCNDIYMFTIPLPADTLVLDTIASTDTIAAPQPQLTVDNKIKQLMPVALFFHNDEPDRQSIKNSTSVNYETTYKNYAAKRNLYKKVLTKGLKAKRMNPSDKDIEELYESTSKGSVKEEEFKKQMLQFVDYKGAYTLVKQIDTFFDSVDTGMENATMFAQLLSEALKNGEKITITLKSYSSPLASDKYNYHLAKRRVNSIRNYFNEYENGALARYINNKNENEGSLILVEDITEKQEYNSKISDSFSDVKNSVFSLKAAYERKVVITFSSEK
jgi:hypothetical protein